MVTHICVNQDTYMIVIYQQLILIYRWSYMCKPRHIYDRHIPTRNTHISAVIYVYTKTHIWLSYTYKIYSYIGGHICVIRHTYTIIIYRHGILIYWRPYMCMVKPIYDHHIPTKLTHIWVIICQTVYVYMYLTTIYVRSYMIFIYNYGLGTISYNMCWLSLAT